jgi:uncharacterized protein YecE (DUF72 family)
MIGVGGWTFSPWRSTFYPEKLPHSRELEYAASKLTSIEINGTYYPYRPRHGGRAQEISAKRSRQDVDNDIPF